MGHRWAATPFCLTLLFLGGCQDSTPSAFYEGLSEPVEVIRDRDGVPHIYAATSADAYYAAGYEMARDRLFQMDLLRRMAPRRRPGHGQRLGLSSGPRHEADPGSLPQRPRRHRPLGGQLRG
jgi:hypothetical protein